MSDSAVRVDTSGWTPWFPLSRSLTRFARVAPGKGETEATGTDKLGHTARTISVCPIPALDTGGGALNEIRVCSSLLIGACLLGAVALAGHLLLSWLSSVYWELELEIEMDSCSEGGSGTSSSKSQVRAEPLSRAVCGSGRHVCS